MDHPNKRIPPSYQLIIICGIIILFLQLYSHAISMFNDSQTNLQVDRFLAHNQKLKNDIRHDIIDSVVENLPSVEVRRNKIESEKGITVLPGEKVFIVPNSDNLALENNPTAKEDAVFKEKVPSGMKTPKEIENEMKKRPVIDQWKWFIFHIS